MPFPALRIYSLGTVQQCLAGGSPGHGVLSNLARSLNLWKKEVRGAMYLGMHWVVPEKIHTPHGGNWQYPPSPDILYKFKTFFRQPYLPFSGRRKFPLWVGYRSFLERPISLKVKKQPHGALNTC